MNQEERIQILQDVINRLNDEVVIPFESYYKHAKTGYHTILRSLFPVFEYLETIGVDSKYKIMQALGIPFPRITWNLYRNSLMHSDEIQLFGLIGSPYDHLSLGWGFGYDESAPHEYAKENFQICINVEKLVYDLKLYCENVKEQVRQSKIKIHRQKPVERRKVDLTKDVMLVDEFKDLHNLYQIP